MEISEQNIKILEQKLKQLNQDEQMVGAIRYIFNKTVNSSLPNLSEGEPDVQVGAKYRAFIMAADLMSKAFKEIEGFKEGTTKSDKYNKGK